MVQLDFFIKSKSLFRYIWILLLVVSSPKIKAQDIAGEMDFTKKTVNQNINPGSADAFTDADFKLYPNPVNGVIHIESKVTLKEGVILTLSDIQGNMLEKKVLGNNVKKEDYSFNLSRYSNGQYIISIISIDGSFVTKKLIKHG